MKKMFLAGLIGLAVISLSACGQVVRSDEVGVLVRDMGANAGVEPQELNTGRHWPAIGSYIITFPKRVQTETWANEPAQPGNANAIQPENESSVGGPPITFTNKDGIRTGIGVSMQLRIDPTKASDLVARYRLGLDEIVDNHVRRRVQGAFSRNGANLTSEELMTGGAASTLIAQVLRDVSVPLAKEGVIIENIEQVGGIEMPQSITARINQNVEAAQQAQREETRVKIFEAQARQSIVEAEARAKAMQIEGDALRANPEILKLREIEKSKGICPMNAQTCVVGGDASAILQ